MLAVHEISLIPNVTSTLDFRDVLFPVSIRSQFTWYEFDNLDLQSRC